MAKRPKGQLVMKLGIKKKPGYLYFLSARGHIARVKMARGKKRKKKPAQVVVMKLGIKRELGYLYFVDRRGDLRRAKMRNMPRKKFRSMRRKK